MKISTNKKHILISLIALIILAATMLTVFMITKKHTEQGKKEITVVVTANDYEKTYTLRTEAEFLGDLLLEEGIVKGEDGPYGLFITEVDGIVADESKQEWWCITRDGGNQMFTSVSEEPLYDGNKYEITLFVGW